MILFLNREQMILFFSGFVLCLALVLGLVLWAMGKANELVSKQDSKEREVK